jgi:hypothetical protein
MGDVDEGAASSAELGFKVGGELVVVGTDKGVEGFHSDGLAAKVSMPAWAWEYRRAEAQQ